RPDRAGQIPGFDGGHWQILSMKEFVNSAKRETARGGDTPADRRTELANREVDRRRRSTEIARYRGCLVDPARLRHVHRPKHGASGRRDRQAILLALLAERHVAAFPLIGIDAA